MSKRQRLLHRAWIYFFLFASTPPVFAYFLKCRVLTITRIKPCGCTWEVHHNDWLNAVWRTLYTANPEAAEAVRDILEAT